MRKWVFFTLLNAVCYCQLDRSNAIHWQNKPALVCQLLSKQNGVSLSWTKQFLSKVALIFMTPLSSYLVSLMINYFYDYVKRATMASCFASTKNFFTTGTRYSMYRTLTEKMEFKLSHTRPSPQEIRINYGASKLWWIPQSDMLRSLYRLGCLTHKHSFDTGNHDNLHCNY